MKKAIKYLRKKEWEMGHGQCDECCGNQPGTWGPHPCVPTKEHEGHEDGCPLAMALEDLGEKVVYKTEGNEENIESQRTSQSVLKRMVIRRVYDDEKYQYMVEDEEGKYMWGCRKDAVLFEYFDARKNQQMLDFDTFLEVL